MSWRSALIAAVVALAMGGCGAPSYIILEVSADLQIPNEANSLHVVTLDASAPNRELANVTFELTNGEAFPLEVLLEPSDDTPPTVRQRVTALLNGVPVARNAVEHPWEPHRANRAAFPLLPVP